MCVMATQSTSAAPGRLELVREFVNTCQLDLGTDTIADPQALAAWLRAAGLAFTAASAQSGDVVYAHEVREALRKAMAANHGRDAIDAQALGVLNALIRDAHLVPVIIADGTSSVEPTAEGVRGALGELLAVTIGAMNDGTWSRLKVCTNDECRWAFYDHSRARSGRWCSMGACGNRAKQRAWRERQS